MKKGDESKKGVNIRFFGILHITHGQGMSQGDIHFKTVLMPAKWVKLARVWGLENLFCSYKKKKKKKKWTWNTDFCYLHVIFQLLIWCSQLNTDDFLSTDVTAG